MHQGYLFLTFFSAIQIFECQSFDPFHAVAARRPSLWPDHRHRRVSLSCCMRDGKDEENDSDEDPNAQKSADLQSHDFTPPYYPPLTAEEKENRIAEMLLIARLTEGDMPTLPDFRKHWFSERGPQLEQLITEAYNNLGRGPDSWDKATLQFEHLLEKDPTWLEPKARYAKLLCLQGTDPQKWEKARFLAQQVLDSKPWHVVTIETMVALYAIRGDATMAGLWMARRLPNMKQGTEARSQWVDRALDDAQTILARMERLQDGQVDDY